MSARTSAVTPDRFDAVLFDLDGVLTATARVHAAAWKEAFDEFLKRRADKKNEAFKPFDLKADYEDYVDGKPRNDGVKSFLASRNIELPYGNPDDPPDKETVCGLGNRKNKLFEEALKSGGVQVFDGSVAWLRYLRTQGIKTAVVSSSKHCQMVVEAAGIADLFDARVDGGVAEAQHLRGKPEPDFFLKAAELLQVKPLRAVVVEDALAGVEAGRNGGFGLAIGVDRKGDAEDLRRHGADLVMTDLGDMIPKTS
jgi:beta-phosphoglucomutase family hydrolase